MSVAFNELDRVFHLDTPHSSYLIALADEMGFLSHMYYGRKIPDNNLHQLLRLSSDTPFKNSGSQTSFLDELPTEYPGHGLGDFRESCLRTETEEGYRACNLTYRSHKIYAGKPKLPGLPATYGNESDCTTLELTAADDALDIEVRLLYTTFEHLDVICRSARIENHGNKPITLTAALSACLDMDNENYELLTLSGAWAKPACPGYYPARSPAGSL